MRVLPPYNYSVSACFESGLIRLLLFALFSSSVFWIQGWTPDIIQDHIFYFQNADVIRDYFSSEHARHGVHEYWKGFSDNLWLSVILAYLYNWTNDHVVSCKIILWANTITFLCSFYIFSAVITKDLRHRFFITILGAFFISYGATFWGFTDFQATLSRTLVLPLQILFLWLYFRYYYQWQRALVFLLLTYSTIIHLSSFHIVGILFVVEILRAAFDSHGGLFVRSRFLLVAILLTILPMFHLANYPARSSVYQFFPFLCLHPPAPYAGPPLSESPQRRAKFADMRPGDYAAISFVTVSAERAESTPQAELKAKNNSPADVWAIELATTRWRNFPPSLSTILMFLSSGGVIFTIATLGFRIRRDTISRSNDRPMNYFACAVMLFAVGPQFLIYLLRHIVTIYPHNIEELRSINMLTIPVIYYCYVFYMSTATVFSYNTFLRSRVVLVVLFLAQPILVLQHLPLPSRLWVLRQVQRYGIVDNWESPRSQFAMQVLRVDPASHRFFYCCEDVIEWLKFRVTPSSLILTNRAELSLAGARVIGSPINFIVLNPRERRASLELKALKDVNALFESNDFDGLRYLATSLGASYFVVPGVHPNAVFRGKYFSVFATERGTEAHSF